MTSHVRFAFSFALLVAIAAIASGCAHRNRATTAATAMLSPAPPPRDPADVAGRAGTALDRARRSGDLQTSAAREKRMQTVPRPTDDAAAPARSTGTSWSVVVGSAPKASSATPPDKDGQSEQDAPAPPNETRRSWKRPVDIIGGSLAAVCCILALRKRGRLSHPHSNDLAA